MLQLFPMETIVTSILIGQNNRVNNENALYNWVLVDGPQLFKHFSICIKGIMSFMSHILETSNNGKYRII